MDEPSGTINCSVRFPDGTSKAFTLEGAMIEGSMFSGVMVFTKPDHPRIDNQFSIENETAKMVCSLSGDELVKVVYLPDPKKFTGKRRAALKRLYNL